jgi:hypothetical protein
MKNPILSLLSLFPFCLLGQQTYYCSPKGNDQNDGKTPETAFQTLARCRALDLSPGDKLLLEGGQSFEGYLKFTNEDEGTPEQPVTLGSYGAGRATIVSPDSTAVLIWNAGGFVVQDLILDGKNRIKNQGYGLCFYNNLPKSDKRKYIRIQRVSAKSFNQDGIYVGGQAIDKSQSGYEDIRIEHCEVSDNQYHGIFVTGIWDHLATEYANRNLYVGYCIANNNTGDPLYYENHSGSGMEIDNVEDALVEYCEAYRNGFLCNSKAGGPCGIWFHSTNRGIIQFCSAISNRSGTGLDGAGFDLDGGTTNCIIQYCYARDNDGAGILVWNYNYAPHRLGDNILRYNVLENNSRFNFYADIFIGSDGTVVENMAVYNNTIFTSAQPLATPACIHIGKGTKNIEVFNNLLITNGNIPVFDFQAGHGAILHNNVEWPINHPNPPAVQAGNRRLNPTLNAFNTGEFPLIDTKGVLLKGYRPLPNSPLNTFGIPRMEKGKPLAIRDFLGNPSLPRSVGAINQR